MPEQARTPGSLPTRGPATDARVSGTEGEIAMGWSRPFAWSRATWGLVVAVAATGLAGCGGGSTAAPSSPPADETAPPRTVKTASPTPSPTPTHDPLAEDVTGLLYLGTNGDSYANGFVIYGIDVSTGVATIERAFPPVEDAEPVMSTWTPVFLRMSFDPQYHRVTATRSDPGTQSQHVGWVTDAGRFVDVTAAVADTGSAFSGAVVHKAPSFGPDGAFYFVDAVAEKLMKVTSASPTGPADAVVVGDADDGTASVYAWPSGTVTTAGAGSIPRVENLRTDVVGQGRVEGWVSETTMLTVSTDLDQITLSDAVPDPSENGWCFGSGTCENNRALLPVREGRISWNPVPSPDGSRVAFLSALEGATEPPQLFLVPVTGGEPTLVTVPEIVFQRPGNGIIGNNTPAQLIGWYQ